MSTDANTANNLAGSKIVAASIIIGFITSCIFDYGSYKKPNGAADKRPAFRCRACSPSAKAQSFYSLVIRQSERSECCREQADAGARRRIRRTVHPGGEACRMNTLRFTSRHADYALPRTNQSSKQTSEFCNNHYQSFIFGLASVSLASVHSIAVIDPMKIIVMIIAINRFNDQRIINQGKVRIITDK